jgi:hypothetical protein
MPVPVRNYDTDRLTLRPRLGFREEGRLLVAVLYLCVNELKERGNVTSLIGSRGYRSRVVMLNTPSNRPL